MLADLKEKIEDSPPTNEYETYEDYLS